MKRYLFIGAIDYSAQCLEALLGMGLNIVEIMCPHKEASRFNSDYVDLGVISKRHQKKVYYFERIENELKYIKDCRPDVIFVFGLSQIIPKNILEVPTIGCLGSHPTLLPQNRGRHPIIWALANGLTKNGITLFWLNEGIDSGDIWAQEEFDISFNDTATTIYQKISDLTVEILKRKIPELEKGIITRISQDHSKANYWRKRTPRDGEIDWRMSSERIYNLTRALTKPYPGAYCNFQGKEIKIWKARIIKSDTNFNNLEPGKVIKIAKNNIVVKIGDGLIELIEHEFENLPKVGAYLL